MNNNDYQHQISKYHENHQQKFRVTLIKNKRSNDTIKN